MRLSKLFKNAPTTNVTGLCFDSRKVKQGNIYFCLPGMTHDGHEYIGQAIERGAICIVHSRELTPEEMPTGAIYIRVNDVMAAMNQCARIYYSSPSDKLLMYGITGTNGKSSIANIIRNIRNLKEPCGYIGTIAIEYGNVRLQPDLTTPDAIFLQEKLSDMVRCGMKACALEVSSHGLAQHRVDAIDFDVAVFTNLTYDHLDYHGTMESYFNAKSILFKDRVKADGVSILNIDDPKFPELKKLSKARVISYGVNTECDYRAINVEILPNQTNFDLIYEGMAYPVKTNLVATYNVYNLLAAIAALHETGMDLETILPACENLPQIDGRLEQINLGQDFHVIVDFAHTPDGMEQMMQFGRKIAGNHQVIAVFGSAGKRDVAKRKVFGQIADQYCDSIILTEDDPRDEDPKEIADQIKEGIKTKPHIFIQDRYEAIRQAVESANKGDVVLLLGKGDEPYIYRENGRAPYKGDNVIVKECIEKYALDHEDDEK
ncbi:UDP-N-acetylmuramoyl-L-alanyl-D-glutamate--2,6-diaminopimelate ligase [Catenisphaera adipataccumulans]|jgi:UDP-N-acetylmuramoyl-L-alanyl-D-glutamate--2,6-diaminopimelate ligase|uniref:UDP-N-acetylmuramyl-tripeptide synthetase n=1 Tax=Catenisphaera adipataccumulans TaxID=700500 RepID=A0A7W8CZG8_9FIRM|nr:UDP-N-acetylmuramoyl-L-alanyl-D-glutamate--2,6-diaminopimelate ligase [Catenisphaera adipataccumulans]MBB5183288.1 UDP-N-acetylmuramoyl-L-alanyl-D-glutamate--2,6-diaminopimelate ligase [Catenisphaera adipataccumulans]